MSYRIKKNIFLVAPGATIPLVFWWPKPGDAGAVWAMAHPMRGEPPSWLATERVAKRVDCVIAKMVINGPAHYYDCGDPGTAYWRYRVEITNYGTKACRFQLEVGRV